MAKVQDMLDTQKRIEESLSSRMAEFEKSMKTATSSEGKLSLDKLAQEYKVFKEMVWSILQCLRSQVQAISSQLDDLETYNRRNALLFNGIEEMDSEDCKTIIVKTICTTMKITDFQESHILFCHRLGTKNTTKPRPVIVRFNDVKTRNMLWSEKKRLKSSSTVMGEFLTRPRQAIFGTARRHFGVNRCWTRDGAVYIKLPNNERKRVSSAPELDLLIDQFPSSYKDASNTSEKQAHAGSSTDQPPARRNAFLKAKFHK